MVIVRIKYDLVRFCSCMGAIVLVIIKIILLWVGWSFCKTLLAQRKEVDGFVSLCFFVHFLLVSITLLTLMNLIKLYRSVFLLQPCPERYMTAFFFFVQQYDNC